jgi:hypothetical protein
VTGPDVEGPVERQLAAYNAHDIAAFLTCYHDRVVVEDATGNILMRGIGELRQTYGPLFRDHPDACAEIVHEARVGAYIVQEELVTGLAPDPVRAVAVFHLDEREGTIDHVRFIS